MFSDDSFEMKCLTASTLKSNLSRSPAEIDLQFRKLSSNLKISNLISLDFPDGSREFVVLRGFEAEIKSFCCRKPHIEIEKSREISARSVSDESDEAKAKAKLGMSWLEVLD